MMKLNGGISHFLCLVLVVVYLFIKIICTEVMKLSGGISHFLCVVLVDYHVVSYCSEP